MAFFAYDATRQAVQTIGPNDKLRTDGVGAYFAYDATHEAVQPINGLALGDSATLSDQALRSVIGKRPALLVAGEWATRLTDTAWRPPSSSGELSLIQITDQDLAQAKRASFGHELPMLAVLSPTPVLLERAKGIFVGTPFVFHEELAIYNIADGRVVPDPLFLLTAVPREPDDPDGGSARMQQSASAVGGKLVYPIALPARRAPRRLPQIQAALARMPAMAPRPVPGAPPPPPTPSIVYPPGGAPRPGFQVGALRGVAEVMNSKTFQVGLIAVVGVGLVGAGIVMAKKHGGA